MPSHVSRALYLPQLVLIIYLFSTPVLTSDDDQTAVDKSYEAFDKANKKICFLSAFRLSVTIKPFNETFLKTTFTGLRPEVMQASHSKCEDQILHYYRFNDSLSDHGNDSLHQSLLTVGFELSADRAVSIHFKFVQILCSTPGGCFRKGYTSLCSPQLPPEELSARNCYLMSAHHHLDWLKANQSHQCSHNSKISIKDVVYYDEFPIQKGYFDIDIDFYRVDVVTGQYSGHFNPISYCLKDWILDTYSLIVFGIIICLIILLIIAVRLIDCRSAKKNLSNGRAKKCVLEDEAQHDSQLIHSEL